MATGKLGKIVMRIRKGENDVCQGNRDRRDGKTRYHRCACDDAAGCVPAPRASIVSIAPEYQPLEVVVATGRAGTRTQGSWVATMQNATGKSLAIGLMVTDQQRRGERGPVLPSGAAVGTLMTGCSWCAPAGWSVDTGGVGDGTVSVPAPAPAGGVAVPLPVLNRVNGVTVSRVWVPVLQVPTVAGARVTVSTPVTFSLPAQWQAPGMPDWRQTPWASRGVTKRAGARRKQDGRRDNRLRAAHRGFGARFGGGPGRRATPRCDPARTGISGGRFAPKLFCIDNPPMGGHSPLCRAAA